jgi:hypothetical protein
MGEIREVRREDYGQNSGGSWVTMIYLLVPGREDLLLVPVAVPRWKLAEVGGISKQMLARQLIDDAVSKAVAGVLEAQMK